jgi:alcohol dehydrogenase class IV
MSCPPQVTASCGLDVVTHAVESFTARPYTSRPAPKTPDDRPPYQGANPIADLWSSKALEYGGEFLRRAVSDPDDVEARGTMMLGASIAGVGFGSAGTHLPHACAYPIASLRHEWSAEGYPDDHAFVPHGFAVVITAPAAFRFTFEADPEKHRRAAELLSGEALPEPDPEALPAALIGLMRDVGAPRGLRELGYGEDDMEGLVQGALKQQRQLSIAPREAGPAELEQIFRESMENW